jgi:hypothetical protein
MIKYGVICTHDLVHDLEQWSSLYASGRLHKPVVQLTSPDARLTQALERNHWHALNAALLLLPARFSPRELWMTIAGLSYAGDFRMVFGENPDKVRNIVDANADGFAAIYAPLIARHPFLACDTAGFANDDSPLAFDALVRSLPNWVLTSLEQQLQIRSGAGPAPTTEAS